MSTILMVRIPTVSRDGAAGVALYRRMAITPPREPRQFTIPAPADDLCLRFVNTRYWRGSQPPTETLLAPTDLDQFLLTEARLPAESVGHADTEALTRGLLIRELLYRLLAAQAQGRAPNAEDLRQLNEALRQAPARAEVSLTPDGRSWLARGDGLYARLAPILWSAADLMLGSRADRVRQCDNPACGWLFLDDSKSGNRRWCAMSACGNRAKARRHYAKVKARAATEPT